MHYESLYRASIAESALNISKGFQKDYTMGLLYTSWDLQYSSTIISVAPSEWSSPCVYCEEEEICSNMIKTSSVECNDICPSRISLWFAWAISLVSKNVNFDWLSDDFIVVSTSVLLGWWRAGSVCSFWLVSSFILGSDVSTKASSIFFLSFNTLEWKNCASSNHFVNDLKLFSAKFVSSSSTDVLWKRQVSDQNFNKKINILPELVPLKTGKCMHPALAYIT